ncbi:hypothetical protein [Spirillospora sp. NPDC047279]|uniref:hypothetical protein n=1 Tax=Spirillospora sp. NPDC047279 TaxID=3155478 RepID=UPI0034003B98
MGEILTLPVPETLHGTYAVAAPAAPADPWETARAQVSLRVEPPLRDLVLGMLDSPLLTLDLRAAAEFPPLPADLLALYGASADELAGIRAATHILAVRAAYRPGGPPVHEWAARAVAGAVATPGSHVVDVFTPRVLTTEQLWRSLPDADGVTRLTDWMLLPHTEGPHGLWFTTKGLARFGLPELQTEHVPPRLLEPWGRLLNGLARRLLDLWTEELHAARQSAFVELPGLVSVGLQDVAAAHGVEEQMRREVTVRLRLDDDDTPLITVLAADDGPDRLEALCAALFGTGVP